MIPSASLRFRLAVIMNCTGSQNLKTLPVLTYGLYHMAMRQGDRFETFIFPGQSPYNIEFTKVYSVIQDREKILWVATDNGLFNSTSKLNSSLHLVLRQDKERASISSVLELPGGDIWVGTWGRGVLTRQPDLKKRESFSTFLQMMATTSSPGIFTSKFPEERSGMACQGRRLMIYDTAKNRSVFPETRSLQGFYHPTDRGRPTGQSLVCHAKRSNTEMEKWIRFA